MFPLFSDELRAQALAMIRNSLKCQNGHTNGSGEHLDNVPHIFTVLGASVSECHK